MAKPFNADAAIRARMQSSTLTAKLGSYRVRLTGTPKVFTDGGFAALAKAQSKDVTASTTGETPEGTKFSHRGSLSPTDAASLFSLHAKHADGDAETPPESNGKTAPESRLTGATA